MADCMEFPNDWAKFLEDYSFRDHNEFYTNGARLIPTFRVEQMMHHYLRKAAEDSVQTEKGKTMNDLISRKALLAEYDRVHIGEPGKARKLIEDAPAVTDNNVGDKLTPTDKDICVLTNGVTVQQWIPVSEMLPFAEYGESDDVLAITELGAMRTLYFNGGNWCFQNGDCCLYKITHWMPLPEPPKEE